MNILAGRLRADAGSIELFGRALRPGSPAAALAAGIAAVHQSPMLFERMTWEENLALGGFGGQAARAGRARLTIDLKEVAARAGAMAARLGFALPVPGVRMEQRSMAERVRMEVLRALSFEPRVLILDEPTGLLAPGELTAFLEVLQRLRGEGRIVILVTHKLAEALAVADRIAVLRRGRVVAHRARGEVTEDELAVLMIGEVAPPFKGAPTAEACGTGGVEEKTPLEMKVLLEIQNLAVERDRWRALDGLSLAVAAGEIVGIAGVDGNGQSELVEAIAGVRRPLAGLIRADGGAGAIAVIPENRDLDGLVLDMPLWENLLLARPLLGRACGRFGWLSAARAFALMRAAARALSHPDRRPQGARGRAFRRQPPAPVRVTRAREPPARARRP